jgi:hypothetical protein
VVAPYKKPERDLPDNESFNNHLSIVRIRSEHAIGFLKGRFASLKALRIRISNEKSHKFATFWIACCIGIHSFAMICEEEESSREGGSREWWDSFIDEGMSSASDSDDNTPPVAARRASRRLQKGKAHREKLKQRLFRAKEKGNVFKQK